jgi:hypothetical protein
MEMTMIIFRVLVFAIRISLIGTMLLVFAVSMSSGVTLITWGTVLVCAIAAIITDQLARWVSSY